MLFPATPLGGSRQRLAPITRTVSAAALVVAMVVGTLAPASAQVAHVTVPNVSWFGAVATFSAHPGTPVDNAAVVHAIYEALTGAAPDPRGLEIWVSALDNGTPRSEVAAAIGSGAAGHRQTAARIYRELLKREIDGSGLAWATGEVARGGPNRLRSALLGSQEYWHRSGGSSTAYVTALYRDLLGREPDGAGLTHFVHAVDTVGRGRAVGGLLGGREVRQRQMDARVTALLGRPPTGAERAFALAVSLFTSGEVHLAAGIIDSPSWLLQVPGSIRAQVSWNGGSAVPAVVRRSGSGLQVLAGVRPSGVGTVSASVELLVDGRPVDRATTSIQVVESDTARWVRAAQTAIGSAPSGADPAMLDRLATGGSTSRRDEVRRWHLDAPAINTIIDGMYRRHLRRPASGGEVAAWIGRLKGGTSLMQVHAEMLGSAEVWANRASGNVEGFAAVLTRDLLGREPSPSDIGYVRDLLSSTTRVGAARAFIGTSEARAHLVRRVFPEVLDRTPDGREVSRWAARIAWAPDELELRSALISTDAWFTEAANQ
ncbi:MAG: DUF4214 domain-containing protein [Acidimicrobiia bacterium]|nr:DUF4214 domain-containing protein [Acidimicrobiia bacterium]